MKVLRAVLWAMSSATVAGATLLTWVLVGFMLKEYALFGQLTDANSYDRERRHSY